MGIVTYDQVSNIPDQASRQHIQQTVYAQLPYLGEVDQVIARCEKSRRNHTNDATQQKDSAKFPLALGIDDFDFVPRRNGRVTDGFDRDGVLVFFFFPFSFNGSAAKLRGHSRSVALALSVPEGS